MCRRTRAVIWSLLVAGGVMADPATTAKKHPPASTASGKPTGKASAKGKSARGSGKRGRARVAVASSYQSHPDPDRYKQIQQALADRGYYKGEVNGEWKDDSTDALRRFQADQKLTDDGKISALSLTALGLGPRHDGSTAATVPAPPSSSVTAEPAPPVPPPASEPTEPPRN